MKKNLSFNGEVAKAKQRAFSLRPAVLAGVLLAFARPALATDPPGAAAARRFVETLNEVILLPLVALLMGVAFLVFLYGAAEYIRGANNPAAREQGAKHLSYGVIGLVVMVSAWAILNLAAGTFGLSIPT